MYYTKKKVMQIMKEYHTIQMALRDRKKVYKSVGVAQYGIEATLPKSNKTSDVVADEAIKHADECKVFAGMRTDLKYIQDRMYRVEDKDEEIFTLRISGHNIVTIAHMLDMKESTVQYKLSKIARNIISKY